MSYQAVRAVLQHSRHKASARMVLVAIAEHAHADGTGSFPSQETLAAESGLSDRQVRTILQRLIASGEIVATKRGRGFEYAVVLPGPTKTSGIESEGGEQKPPPFGQNLPVNTGSFEQPAYKKLPTNRPPTVPVTLHEPSTSGDAAQAQQMRTNAERGRGGNGTRPHDDPRRVPPGTTQERAVTYEDGYVRAFARKYGRAPTHEELVANGVRSAL